MADAVSVVISLSLSLSLSVGVCLTAVQVCTTFLEDRLAIGQSCAVFVNNNPDFRLPQDDTTPIVMARAPSVSFCLSVTVGVWCIASLVRVVVVV
jgi:hypothetical protein